MKNLKKQKMKSAVVNLLILVIVTFLILYIYAPYRIESTIDYNMTKYFEKHKEVSRNILQVSEKLQPMYNAQYERAMDMTEAESEEEAMKIAEEVKELGIEMEQTFLDSSEYAEIMKLDEQVIGIQTEIVYNLDQLDEEKREELLDVQSEKHSIEKAQLVQMLMER